MIFISDIMCIEIFLVVCIMNEMTLRHCCSTQSYFVLFQLFLFYLCRSFHLNAYFKSKRFPKIPLQIFFLTRNDDLCRDSKMTSEDFSGKFSPKYFYILSKRSLVNFVTQKISGWCNCFLWQKSESYLLLVMCSPK